MFLDGSATFIGDQTSPTTALPDEHIILSVGISSAVDVANAFLFAQIDVSGNALAPGNFLDNSGPLFVCVDCQVSDSIVEGNFNQNEAAPLTFGMFTFTIPSNALPGEVFEFAVDITQLLRGPVPGAIVPIDSSENFTLTVAQSNRSPEVGDDAFWTTGNSFFQITDQLLGLLANDTDLDMDNLSVLSQSGATTQGGLVEVFSDGTFDYTPPIRFQGADTFSYSVTDDQSATDIGQVTFNVSQLIWHVDSNTILGGDGRSSSPFD